MRSRRQRSDTEPGEPAPDRRDADAGEDERVSERTCAERRDGDDDHSERPERVPDDRRNACGPEVEDVLCLRNRQFR